MSRSLVAVSSLTWRELVRFYRQKSRVVGVIGSALLFWFLIGSGVGRTFASPAVPEEMGYLEFLFPGTLAFILLMTSLFSTISLIQDRNEGFLQGVLVSPIPRWAVVAGKIGGGTALAVTQGALFLAVAPWAGFPLGASSLVSSVAVMALFSAGLVAFAFVFAWRIDSVQGFHAVMNLLLFPLWLLSGAVFPLSTAPAWLRATMFLNPLTYGVAAIRECLGGPGTAAFLASPPMGLSLAILFGFGLGFFAMAARQVARGRS